MGRRARPQPRPATAGVARVLPHSGLLARRENKCVSAGFRRFLPLFSAKGLHFPLEQLAAEADVITFHTPLTRTGTYPTYHLCDAAFLSHCRPRTLIINAARGGVVDEEALLQSGLPCAIDTWEGEPDINRNLLQHAWLASYHIAGYSLEGKINASQMVLDAFCRFFQRKACIIDKKAVTLHARSGDSAPGWLQRITEELKAQPDGFERLRKAYVLR